MDKLELLDTTIRDGELSPTFNPGFEQRMQIAQSLDRAGIDIIELASTDDDEQRRNQSREIASSLKNARACCISQISADHIEIARGVLDGVEQARIHLYLDAKRVHDMANSEQASFDAIEAVTQSISRARNLFSEVQFSPQDATRCEADSLCSLIAAAVAAGAGIINISDTTGTATPALIAELLRRLRESVPQIEHATLSLHAHNHLGRAVDNVFNAIDCGVRQIEGTVNGVGPAGGNTDLLEVLSRLQTNSQAMSSQVNADPGKIHELAQQPCFSG